MCRLFYLRAAAPVPVAPFLHKFAAICRESKEYQGHGWGCSWIEEGEWRHYHNILPVWQDDPGRIPDTSVLVAHARSAFRDQDIRVENNMPFTRDDTVFIFNGELHGVRIREEGRIGAEKIFAFLHRFSKNGWRAALEKGAPLIEQRSRHIRAMNIIIAQKEQAFFSSLFNEDADYFTMYRKYTNEMRLVCSDPFPGETGWEAIANRTTGEI
jgi:predicted glutamine amidotransferase